MKKFKDNINDFFRWVNGTDLVELDNIDVSEDPVRPELSLNWRTSHGRKIFGLRYQDAIEGIICVAFTTDVPHSIRELDMMSELANIKDVVKPAPPSCVRILILPSSVPAVTSAGRISIAAKVTCESASLSAIKLIIPSL